MTRSVTQKSETRAAAFRSLQERTTRRPNDNLCSNRNRVNQIRTPRSTLWDSADIDDGTDPVSKWKVRVNERFPNLIKRANGNA